MRRRPSYTYLAAKRMRNGRLGIVEKRIKGSKPNLRKTERKAQGTLMMARRIMGEGTMKRLGEDFNLSTTTVRRRLNQAEIDGVPTAARDIFISEMLPASMAVLKAALEGDDVRLAVQIALKVVDGMKVMEPAAASTASIAEENFDSFRARFARSNAIDVAPTEAPPVAESSPNGASDVSLRGLPSGESSPRTDPEASASNPANPREASGEAGVPAQRTIDAAVDPAAGGVNASGDPGGEGCVDQDPLPGGEGPAKEG